MKKIVITGPESTGKSTLTKQLAEHFQVSFVYEYAREYINSLNRDYTKSDLLEIAKGQFKLQQEIENSALKFTLTDTDLLTIKIWSEFKYGKCDEWVIKTLKSNLPDLYLLCDIDLPWEIDPQREHPEKRKELFDIYQNEIKALDVPFKIIKGIDNNRFENANQEIIKLLN